MSAKRKLLKQVYPLLMKVSAWAGGESVILNKESKEPPISFYSLSAEQNTGQKISFEQFRGKKVLLVNTASDCGFTGQYASLQKLYSQFESRLQIVAFPSNEFKNQESGSDAEIARFCQIEYGIEFPVMKKTGVLKGQQQHPVYQWLTSPEMNGWNPKNPSWNFCKYLVDEQGNLMAYSGPYTDPLSKELLNLVF